MFTGLFDCEVVGMGIESAWKAVKCMLELLSYRKEVEMAVEYERTTAGR